MITNQKFIQEFITTNDGKQIPYLWSHGATESHLGDGIIVYSLIQQMRSKVCVCIGSGGGFIPRIITQARIDLYNQKIFEGNPDYNWGDIGVTYLVDACNGIGGPTNIEDENSFFRSTFYPRLIKSTSVDAYYDFFVRQDIKIDFLFIDGDHSYEGVKKDFELYSTIMSENGIITIHDTDKRYSDSFLVTEDGKKDFQSFHGPAKFIKELENNPYWNLVNLKNFRMFDKKVTSTGLALLSLK